MLFFVSAIQLVAFIAILAFIGRFVLGLLAGPAREKHFVYQLLGVMTQPFERLMRMIAPRAVLDRHMPLAAFAALVSAWVVSTIARIDICLQIGMEHCR